MKIAHVRISNILGIEHLEFTPEGFNAITGPNGKGKTSVLEAIKSATGQGHDATLLRKGAEKGEVVLVLDDGTEIQQRVTAARTTRDVVQDGKKIGSPSSAIKALTDTLSVNPVEFLTAVKKDRVKVLLESMPIKLDAAHLSAISGVKVEGKTEIHALSVIDAVRQQVFDDRTFTNRALKEKDGTINQLETAMPELIGGIDGNEDELREQLQAAQQTRDAEAKRIDDKLAALRVTSAAKVQALKDEARDRIDAINEELRVAMGAEKDALADTEAKAGRVRQKALDTFTAAAEPLKAAIGAIVANRDAAAKRQATKDTIERMRTDLRDLASDAARQTEAIEAIDHYKHELLANLPIPNIEVKDGEVFREGVAFDRLNTAQRVGIAFEIAKLRAGTLAVVCLDGMELLDSEHLAELEAQAEQSGMQVFVTRVQGKDFAVETR